jgi:thymidylate kinase
VQKGFLRLAKKNIKKYKIVDSNLDINSNQNKIIQIIDRLI